MKQLNLEKRMKFLVILLLMGISAFAQESGSSDHDYFDIREYEAKLSIRDIFTPNANLNGGIKGIVYNDGSYDDDFFNPIIDIVVRDKETNTIIYEIYINQTSDTYNSSKYWEYYSPELGKGANFFPFIWESNDIKNSIIGLDRFRHSEYENNRVYVN